MAVTFDDDIEFSMKTRLENIQLILKGIVCRVSGVVAAYRRGDRSCHIILFDEIEGISKDKIRAFIHKQLQDEMKVVINELKKSEGTKK